MTLGTSRDVAGRAFSQTIMGCRPSRRRTRSQIKFRALVSSYLVMIISAICAPADAPQLYDPPVAPAQSPRLDRLDNELVEAIRENGRYGALIWAVLNWIAADQNLACRAQARSIRIQLWQRLRRLLRAGLVFRFGRKAVTSVKLPSLTVRRSRRSRAGSTIEKTGDERRRSTLKSPSFNLL